MATYSTPKVTVNLTRLQKELSALLPGAIQCMGCDGVQVTVMTTRDLTPEEQTSLANVVTSHAPVNAQDIVNGKINNAMKFGNDLLVEFATDNVMLGITQANKTRVVADFCSDIMRYIQSGSLYEVMNEVDRLVAAGIPAELAPFITSDRLISFKSKIAAFLA